MVYCVFVCVICLCWHVNGYWSVVIFWLLNRFVLGAYAAFQVVPCFFVVAGSSLKASQHHASIFGMLFVHTYLILFAVPWKTEIWAAEATTKSLRSRA